MNRLLLIFLMLGLFALAPGSRSDGAAGATGAGTGAGAGAGAADLVFWVGGDLSLVPRVIELGGVYRDEHGRPIKDVLQFLKDRGWNTVRLRLWVNPTGRREYVNDLPYTLKLAKQLKAHGLRFVLDFHYSDTWADPAKQGKPAAWAELPFDDLVKQVHDYSRDVLAELRHNGVTPQAVQIGNEIAHGMLWPDGKSDTGESFDRLARLLKAAREGVLEGAAGPEETSKLPAHAPSAVKAPGTGDTGGTAPADGAKLNDADADADDTPTSAAPAGGAKTDDADDTNARAPESPVAKSSPAKSAPAPPLIIIHVHSGSEPDKTQWFFDNLRRRGVEFDIIALSAYPTKPADLEGFDQTLKRCARRYHKPILLAELGYRWTDKTADGKPLDPPPLADAYPTTPAGQAELIGHYLARLHATPGGLGLLWWEPTWIRTPHDKMGAWDEQALFDFTGKALPGITALGRKADEPAARDNRRLTTEPRP